MSFNIKGVLIYVEMLFVFPVFDNEEYSVLNMILLKE